MSKRRIISIICMVLMLLLIGNMFLPFLSDGDVSFSFWEYISKNVDAIEVDIIVLLLLLGGAVVFLLQVCNVFKDAKPAYYPLGYYFTYHVILMISMMRQELFKYLSIGFYFGLVISLAVLVLLIISNRLDNHSSETPVGYDPKTGKPIYFKPTPKGYDPRTGEPIY